MSPLFTPIWPIGWLPNCSSKNFTFSANKPFNGGSNSIQFQPDRDVKSIILDDGLFTNYANHGRGKGGWKLLTKGV